jgi:hypothetical protein
MQGCIHAAGSLPTYEPVCRFTSSVVKLKERVFPRLNSVFDVDRRHPVGRSKLGSVAPGKHFLDPQATALLQCSTIMHCP